MRVRPILSWVPTLPLPVLGLVLGAHVALKGLVFWPPFQTGVALPVEARTGGAVTAVTVAGLLSWTVLVGLLMGGVAALRPRHVGLSAGAFWEALPILLWVWILVQAAHVAMGAASGTVSIVPTSLDLSASVGQRVEAVVGSGLLEEVFYRGFLLVQAYGLLRRRMGRERALALAVVASSVYFGLNHIRAGLRAGLSPAEVAAFAVHCALVGALFAALFLRTGNLFIAAGAHALINDPLPFVDPPVDPSLTMLVGVCVLALAWPALAQRFREVFAVGSVEGSPAV